MLPVSNTGKLQGAASRRTPQQLDGPAGFGSKYPNCVPCAPVSFPDYLLPIGLVDQIRC